LIEKENSLVTLLAVSRRWIANYNCVALSQLLDRSLYMSGNLKCQLCGAQFGNSPYRDVIFGRPGGGIEGKSEHWVNDQVGAFALRSGLMYVACPHHAYDTLPKPWGVGAAEKPAAAAVAFKAGRQKTAAEIAASAVESAKASYDAGDMPAALSSFSNALQHTLADEAVPADAVAYLRGNVALCYHHLGTAAQAAAAVAAGLEDMPDAPAAHLWVGLLHYLQGGYLAAATAFFCAFATENGINNIAPSTTNAVTSALGEIKRGAGKFTPAMVNSVMAVVEEEDSHLCDLAVKAMVLAVVADGRLAKPEHGEGLAVMCHTDIAQTFLFAEMARCAVEAARHFAAAHPAAVEAHMALGGIYECMTRFDDAVEAFLRADAIASTPLSHEAIAHCRRNGATVGLDADGADPSAEQQAAPAASVAAPALSKSQKKKQKRRQSRKNAAAAGQPRCECCGAAGHDASACPVLGEVLQAMQANGMGGGGDDFDEFDDGAGGCYGFSGADVEELAMQGVKPWDDDAGAVMAALNGDY
jgi:tetratricopeptide (TPR) repeat protein